MRDEFEDLFYEFTTTPEVKVNVTQVNKSLEKYEFRRQNGYYVKILYNNEKKERVTGLDVLVYREDLTDSSPLSETSNGYWSYLKYNAEKKKLEFGRRFLTVKERLNLQNKTIENNQNRRLAINNNQDTLTLEEIKFIDCSLLELQDFLFPQKESSIENRESLSEFKNRIQNEITTEVNAQEWETLNNKPVFRLLEQAIHQNPDQNTFESLCLKIQCQFAIASLNDTFRANFPNLADLPKKLDTFFLYFPLQDDLTEPSKGLPYDVSDVSDYASGDLPKWWTTSEKPTKQVVISHEVGFLYSELAHNNQPESLTHMRFRSQASEGLQHFATAVTLFDPIHLGQDRIFNENKNVVTGTWRPTLKRILKKYEDADYNFVEKEKIIPVRLGNSQVNYSLLSLIVE